MESHPTQNNSYCTQNSCAFPDWPHELTQLDAVAVLVQRRPPGGWRRGRRPPRGGDLGGVGHDVHAAGVEAGLAAGLVGRPGPVVAGAGEEVPGTVG